MINSFRFRLATRFAAAMAFACGGASLVGFAALREVLDREIDSTLLNIASFQAASVTSSPSGQMSFHEWQLTPQEAASIQDLNRYAQVWTETGTSLLRTHYIEADLPLDRDALHRAAGGEVVWREQQFQGGRIRSLYYPLGRLGDMHAEHVLQVAAPLDRRDRVLRVVVLFLGVVAVVAAAGTYFGSWWLADRAMRPVHHIIEQAESIKPGDPRHRIRATADTEEYRRLVDVLNHMLSRLDDASEVLRRFTADASHELRSPLTALLGELEVARRRDRTADEYRRVIDSALDDAKRLHRVAEDLLTLAHSDAGAMEPRLRMIDLVDCAVRIIDRLRGQAAAKQVDIQLRTEGAVTGLFDPDLMDRLIRNLMENAIKFTPTGGRVEVRVVSAGERALLTVTDTGPGIAPEKLERVFDRFFRGDDSRTQAADAGGSGLGLSIARAIVQLHEGKITVSNRREGGAVFTVDLPRRLSS